MSAQTPHAARPRHERKDVDPPAVTMVAALLLLAIAICCLGVFGLLGVVRRTERPGVSEATTAPHASELFPAPRLQVNPALEMQKYQAAVREKLNSYGWIDRRAGIAHIPIDRAMELTLERGLPEVGAGKTRLQLLQSRPETR